MTYRDPLAGATRSGSKKRKRGSSSKRSASKPRKRKSSRSSKRSAARPKKRASSKRAGTARKLYTRYDPETGARVRVASTDERYDEWLTAAAWRSEKKRRTKERQVLVREVKRAVPVQAVVRGARTGAARARTGLAALRTAKVAVGIGAGTVGVGTAAALAILAGAAAYFGTTWAVGKLRGVFDPAERASRLAKAYREARRKAESELGRPLTQEENQLLARDLQAQLAKMGLRPGG